MSFSDIITESATVAVTAYKIGVIKSQIETGQVDPFAKGSEGNTFLHKLLKENCLIPFQFQELCEFLVSKSLSEVFNIQEDTHGFTPFALAVMRVKLEESTLELLHANGVNFNAVDKLGNPVLSFLILSGINNDMLPKMVILGANLKAVNQGNENLLIFAAIIGNVEAAQYLIFSGQVGINEPDATGSASLHCLAQQGRANVLEMGKLLIKNGADLHATNNGKWTALHLAANRKGTNEICGLLKLLVENGCDPYAKTESGYNFLHVLQFSELSPLQFHEIAELIVEKELVSLFNIREGDNGTSPLHLLVMKMAPEKRSLEMLIKAGVDFEFRNHAGHNLLVHSIFGGRDLDFLIILKSLGANPKDKDNLGNTALFSAVEAGNLNAIKFCLEDNEGIVNLKNLKGTSPLHHTIIHGEKNVCQIVKVLIDSGAEINARDISGRTPLSCAAYQGLIETIELIKLLIMRGADPFIKCNKNWTFLHELVGPESGKGRGSKISSEEFHEIAEFLVEKGFGSLFNGESGHTPPLHIALVNGMIIDEKTLDFLYGNGVSFSSEDRIGMNLLGAAVSGRNGKVLIEKLVSLGGEPTHLTRTKKNILHIAASEGTPDILKYFLERNELNVNAQDDDGATPLHYAMQMANVDEIIEKAKLFLEHRGDVNIKNKEGLTPIGHFIRRGDTPSDFAKDMDEMLKNFGVEIKDFGLKSTNSKGSKLTGKCRKCCKCSII